MKQVYLAGPISGCSFNGCTEWRNAVIADLAEANIKGLSPMRAKEYLAALKNISCTGKEYVHMGVLSTPRAVMTRDHFDCTRCDMLLVNFIGAKTVSVGTVMELAWAFTRQIPIVCAIEDEGNPHEHMMVNEAIGFRVNTLEEAVTIVKAVLV